MERFLFQDLLAVDRDAGDRVRDVDLFLVNGFGAWSLRGSGATLAEDLQRAFHEAGREVIRRRTRDLLAVYERMPRVDARNGETDSLVTKVVYDMSHRQVLLQRTLWSAAVPGLILALAVFLVTRRLFDCWPVGPVARIAAALEELGRGHYAPIDPTGVAEVDVITRGVNRMQAELQRREQALRDTSARLEQRVAERTAQLQVLNEELARQAGTDPLTGLANRHAFEKAAGEALARIKDDNRPLTIALLDLENFKAVNDRHGHGVGDRVLELVGRELQAGLRGDDLVARLGGEEFAVLMAGCTVEQAMPVLDRLRQRIKATVVDTAREPISVTISIGVAPCGRDAPDLAAALAAADLALYQAKQHGRNRVVAQSQG